LVQFCSDEDTVFEARQFRCRFRNFLRRLSIFKLLPEAVGEGEASGMIVKDIFILENPNRG